MGAETADRRPKIRVNIAKEHLGHFNHDEKKFLNCISLGMKCGLMILNFLKQKLCQSSGNELVPHFPRSLSCLHLLARLCLLLLGFTWNNTDLFHVKR